MQDERPVRGVCAQGVRVHVGRRTCVGGSGCVRMHACMYCGNEIKLVMLQSVLLTNNNSAPLLLLLFFFFTSPPIYYSHLTDLLMIHL